MPALMLDFHVFVYTYIDLSMAGVVVKNGTSKLASPNSFCFILPSNLLFYQIVGKEVLGNP